MIAPALRACNSRWCDCVCHCVPCACGECAQHRGRVYGLVAPAWEQAQVLADRLACRDSQAVYHGSQVATRLKVMGVELTVVGEKEPDRENDEVVTYTEPSRGIYKKLIVRNGYLAGAILLGDSLTAPPSPAGL
jgi:nitrite reductase (NADH) large subunit